jgi:hypothetical protein
MYKKLLLITFGFLVLGCDYSYKRGEDKTKINEVFQDASSITFAMVNERVIQPSCVRCHSEASGNKGNVNLESYESVFKNRVMIHREVSDRTMPPANKGVLSAEQTKLILGWIDQGAFEEGAPIPDLPSNEVSGTIGTVEVDPILLAELTKQVQLMPESEILKLEADAIEKTKNLELASGTAYPKVMVTAEGYSVLLVDAERTALMYESNTQAFVIKVKLDLTENLCQPEYVKPDCNFHLDASNDSLLYRWIKHSDPKKVGQVVKMKFTGFGEKEFSVKKSSSLYGFVDRYIGRKNDLRFKPDLIVCNRFDWIDPKIENNKSTLKFSSWSTENMVLNPETGINENATFAVYEDVSWKLEKNALIMNGIERVQSGAGFGKFTPVLPIGQASTIQYVQPNGETCQFSFAHSIQAAVAGIDLDKNFETDPRFVVYAKTKSGAYKGFQTLYGQSISSDYAKAEFE